MTVSAMILARLHRRRQRANASAEPAFVSWWRLLGPAFAVSIGYIDPGNWATDLAAGSFRYQLLWSVLLAGMMALALQIAVVRVATVTGRDLATLIAERWKGAAIAFWISFQGAAIATDFAEFTGIVLGLELLFHLSLYMSLIWGITIVGLILVLSDRKAKLLEYGLLASVAAIAIALLMQITHLHPELSAIVQGSIMPRIPNHAALLAIVGIIGATVMPHNLFLHSSLVLKQTRGGDAATRQRQSRFFTGETVAALGMATVINGGLLVVGASLGGTHGSIQDAFSSLQVHSPVMASAFGAALLLSGITASITATTAGEYIFAAFSPVYVKANLRRAITLLPAVALLATGLSVDQILIWSQIILGFILPIALIPLAFIITREKVFKNTATDMLLAGATYAAVALCIGFDAASIMQGIG